MSIVRTFTLARRAKRFICGVALAVTFFLSVLAPIFLMVERAGAQQATPRGAQAAGPVDFSYSGAVTASKDVLAILAPLILIAVVVGTYRANQNNHKAMIDKLDARHTVFEEKIEQKLSDGLSAVHLGGEETKRQVNKIAHNVTWIQATLEANGLPVKRPGSNEFPS